MNTVQALSRHLCRYLTIEGLDGQKTYTYKKRCSTTWNAVRVQKHRDKQKPGSILYMALDSDADLDSLQPGDLLYVGSQTQDRMFRGDGLGGTNFHHREMRLGKGDDNLTSHLRGGRGVTLFTVTGKSLKSLSPGASIFELACPTARGPHPGYSVEQLILLEGHQHWRWNAAGADHPERVRKLTLPMTVK